MTWLKASCERVLLGQRGALYPWAPVFLAFGISLYFALPNEPPLAAYALALAATFVGSVVLALYRSLFAPLVWVCLLVSVGFGLAGGRIVLIDRSASGALRLTLDQVILERLPPNKTPTRVRVALNGAESAVPQAGSTVLITAHLSPPSGPVEPNGFDFQRHAWFQGLGAIGYSRTPLMVLEPARHAALISQARYAFANFVRSEIKGENGAFAAAIMAGDRSAMSQETVDTLRHTNLAHLLAISGLHMGLLSGFIYAAIRYGLVLSPSLRHRVPIRKTAALGALVVSFFYLLLSGGSVATERAFIMAMVALGAIFLNAA